MYDSCIPRTFFQTKPSRIIMSEKKSRNVYMDVIRTVACFMVLFCHISAFCMDEVSKASSQYQAMNLYDCSCIICVALFMMISGAIHLNDHYRLNIKKLYLKKILHLALVFYFWTTFYNIFDFLEYNREWNFSNIKFYIVGRVIRGQGTYHLWFLRILMFIYILSPLLKEAFKTKKICEYYLILHTLLFVLAPTLFKINFPGKDWVAYNIDTHFLAKLQGYLGYVGYFVLGHYIHSFVPKQSKRNRNILIACMLLSSLVNISVCGYISATTDTISTVLMNPLTFFAYVSAICLYIVLRDWSSNLEDLPKWVKIFGSLSFGVYLVHPAVLRIYYHLGVKTTFIHAALMVPVLVIVTALISSVITFILTKIPAIKRLV